MATSLANRGGGAVAGVAPGRSASPLSGRSSTTEKPSVKEEEEKEDEEDDDDDDDDDDDKDEEDAQDINLLTDAQKAAVLAFYGLSELEPTDWAETAIAVAIPGTPGLHGAAAPASAADTATDDAETDRADLLGLFQARRGTAGDPGSAKVDPATEHFDPELYLAQYYGAVSFAQLESGMRNLHDKVDQRTESLRALVRNNLDRFMKSKDTIDHIQFYSGLRARQLLGDAEGSEELRVALTDASTKLTKLFGPMLERRGRSDRLRKILSYYDQNKFIFNLPASLQAALLQHNYEQAVRDYRRGRQVTGVDAVVLDKVWDEAYRLVAALREELEHMLRLPSVPLDVQERTVQHLLELHVNAQGDYEGLADPGHDLLQARFNWISGMVRQSTARFAEAVSGAASSDVGPRRRPPPTLEEEVVRRRTLLEALILQERPDIDAITHIDLPDHRRWMRVLEHTEFVASALAVALPDLARAVRLYCDGHLNRRGGSGPLVRPLQNADEAKAMVATLMDAFVTAIEAALPPYAPPAAQAAVAQDSHRLPHAPWIPSVSGHAAATPAYGSSGQPPALLGLEPLEAAYFIARMANAVGLVAEAMRAAAPKLGSAAWINHVDEAVGPRLLRLKMALARLLVESTSYELRQFGRYEAWVPDMERPQNTTLPKMAHESIRLLILTLHDVFYRFPRVDDATEKRMGTTVRDFLRTAVYDCIVAFGDALHSLALAPHYHEPSSTASDGDADELRLKVLSNASYTREILIPSLLSTANAVYHFVTPAQPLRDTFAQLEERIVALVVLAPLAAASRSLEYGMLWAGMNWMVIGKPSEIRSYVFEALMALVSLHGKIAPTARQFMPLILSTIVDGMARTLLDLVMQISAFSVGGMLQALLEIEFLQQTLAAYETVASKSTFKRIYHTLRASTKLPPSSKAERSRTPLPLADHVSEVLQPELKELAQLLRDNRQATATQFRCFS